MDNYKVVSQTEGLDISDPARPVQVMQIGIRTIPSDVALTVNVPASEYTPARVREILTARAADVEKVHAGEA